MDKLYDLPSSLGEIIELINEVPDGWSCVEGNIAIDLSLVSPDKVSLENILTFSRYSNEPTLSGESYRDKYDQWHNNPADIFGVYFESKFPEHIRFEHAGYDSKPRSFPEMKTLVASLLRVGYRGRLRFIKDFVDDSAFCHSGVIEFFMSGRSKRDVNAHRVKTIGHAPALSIFGPSQELTSMISLVHDLGLRSNTEQETIIEPKDVLIAELKKNRGRLKKNADPDN